MILHHLISVHDANTGDALWRHDHEIDIAVSLFITKQIAGYSLGQRSDPTIRIFNAENGDVIAEKKIKETKNPAFYQIAAKDNFLCWSDGLVVHIIKVTESKVGIYKVPFPLKHFVQNKCLDPKNAFCKIDLEGFVGKTNVVFANLCSESNENYVLLTLDLEAATTVKHKREMTMAFKLPLSPEGCEFSNKYKYLPYYETDRVNECVDLIGAIGRKEVESVTTWEARYFVTEMEIPRTFLT